MKLLRTTSSVSSIIILSLLLALTPLLTACRTSSPSEDVRGGSLRAVATIFPQYDFLRAIGGDHLDLHMLLTPGAESHSFEPTPADILTVSECDLFVYVGGESDAWIDTILESVDTSHMEIVTLMDCVDTLAEETTEGMQSHEPAGHAADGDEAEQDEHVWTSPKNAILIVEKLRDALCRLDDAHADEYTANAAAYIEQLRGLDEAFLEVTSDAARSTILFGDRFPFRYLADAYGLTCYAAFPGCAAESEASVRTLAFLIDKARTERIPVVFQAELSNGRMADSICEAAGARKLLLHSCHNVSKEEFEQGATYLSLMEQNVRNLKEALAP